MKPPSPPRTDRPFIDLRATELEPATLAPGLFLSRFSRPVLMRELEDAGLFHALAERGYRQVVVRTEEEQGEHRLCVLSSDESAILIELRLSERTCVVEDSLMLRHGLDVLYLLSVHWFSLQHPAGTFTPERPRLPGQTHPGLGFGRRVYGRLMAWAHEWGKDGLLNFPAYFHNAVFYSTLFRFVSPVRQGRVDALRRDLAGLHVCEASAAVNDGRVVEEPGGGVLRWEAGEMVAPITRGLCAYLDSAEYGKASAAARNQAHFRVTGGGPVGDGPAGDGPA